MLAFALLSALFAFGALAIHKGWMPGLLPVPFVLLGISLVSLTLSAGDLLSANLQDGLIGALSGMPIVLVLFFYILAHYPYRIDKKFERDLPLVCLFLSTVLNTIVYIFFSYAATVGMLVGFLCLVAVYFITDYILRRRSVAKPDPNGIVNVDQVQPLVFDPKVFN